MIPTPPDNPPDPAIQATQAIRAIQASRPSHPALPIRRSSSLTEINYVGKKGEAEGGPWLLKLRP